MVQLELFLLVAIMLRVLAFVVLKEYDCSERSSTPSNKLVTIFEVEVL